MTIQGTLRRRRTSPRWRPGILICLIALAAVPAGAGIELPVPDELTGDPEAEGFADLLYANGMLLLNEGKHGEAFDLFERAARAVPNNATYSYFVGFCQLRLERYAEAVESLTRSLPPARGEVREAVIRSDLGQAHARDGQPQAAEDELRRAIELDGEYAPAHLWLGLVLFETGDTEASVHLQRAAELDADLAGVAAYYKGVEAHRRGDDATAVDAFEEASRSRYGVGIANNGQLWLAALKEDGARRTPPFEARVGLLGEHDTSPAALPSEAGVEEDNRIALEMRVVGQYQPRRGPWAVGGFANGYGSAHSDFELGDLRGAQIGVQGVWGGFKEGYLNGTLGYMQVPDMRRRFSVMVQAASTYFYLDGESFRRDHEAAVSLFIHQFDFGMTQVEIKYGDLTYFDRDSAPFDLHPFLTGKNRMLRIGQYFQLGERKGRYARVAIGHTSHTGTTPDVRRQTGEALLELSLPFGSRWNVFVNGSYLDELWDPSSAPTLGISAPREESQLSLGASLAVVIVKHCFVTARYVWYDREIQPPDFALGPGVPFSYKRSVTSLGAHFVW